MPESKGRKAAERKKTAEHKHETAVKKDEKAGKEAAAAASSKAKTRSSSTAAKPQGFPKSKGKPRTPNALASRAWVPPVFITVGLLGVFWLIVYYIAGYKIPFMSTLGGWNILIGMGLMAASFGIATLWK